MFNKVTLLSFAIFLSSSIILAQNPLKQGAYRVGGGVSFSSGTSEDNYNHNLGIRDESVSVNSEAKNISFSINPSYSYFVTDNILIGASIRFSYGEIKTTIKNKYMFVTSTITNKNINRLFDIGPIIRYYFDSENIIPFIGAGASYSKYLGEDFETKNLYMEVGISYFFAANAALEPSLSYTVSSVGSSDNSRKEFSVGVGFMYYIIPQ